MSTPAFPTRLLIVETDDEARTFLRRRFTRLGYQITDTGDAEKALALIGRVRFDLALIDLATGANEDGFALLRALRERAGPVELPILAVADEAAAEDANEALALGANDCILKPLYVGVAQSRIEMLLGRHQGPEHMTAAKTLAARIETLGEAAHGAEAVSAVVSELGPYICSPLNALLGAASVLTGVCKTPELKGAIAAIETAAGALDMVIVRALGRADRRNRGPKAKIAVLLADHDLDSRMAIHKLLDATEVQVELVEARAGLEAALATDTAFFDLIMMNLETPEATAGIRAIRRGERDNKTRRTPVLAFGAGVEGQGPALDAGADLYLATPVTADALLTALAEALVREANDLKAVA